MTSGARLVAGRARVVREVRAADPLARRLRAPLTARGPWLTAVLAVGRASPVVRPVAVVVDDPREDAPAAAAFLLVRRRGPRAAISLLGAAAQPLPGGRPTARLLARDEPAAQALAAGIAGLPARCRGPWSLDLAGLPLGDPTAAALAARLPTATLRTERSRLLVDDLPAGERSSDPAVVDRLLQELLPGEPDRRARRFLRVAARLHAAIGAVEVASGPAGGLLTLVDAGDRWPWWAAPGTAVRSAMGAPVVRLSAAGWSGRAVSPSGGR
jgi:hypothetical protein